MTAPDTAQPSTTDVAPPAPLPTTSQRQFPAGFAPSPRVQQSQWRTYDDQQAGRQQPSYTAAPAYDSTPPYQSSPQYRTAPSDDPIVSDQPAPVPPPALQAAPSPPPPTVRRATIAPVDAPDGFVLVGGSLAPYDPAVVDPNLVEQFNNAAAALQADGGNFLVDVGFADASQADRIAAGAATGIVVGGTTGALVAGVPATAAGTIGGAVIGLGVGAVVNPVTWLVPGFGWVFGPGLGAAIGAGVGALALGAPATVIGAGIGAGVGGLIGATVAGGEQQIIEEPAPAPAPAPAPVPVPSFDPIAPGAQLPAQVQSVLDTTATQAQTVLEQAPAYAEQARTAIAADPVGGQVLAAADTAAADLAPLAAPVIEQATSAVDDALTQLNSFIPA